MSSRFGKTLVVRVCAALAALQGLEGPARCADLLTKAKAKWHNHQGLPTAEALAVEIGCLEKHIDWYGTIVAKQPDVWGQARLTKHRQEFETIMAGELDKFTPTLQGSISRSDQAFLASATSLSAAISGAPAVSLPPVASVSQEVVSGKKAALTTQEAASPDAEQPEAGADSSKGGGPAANPSAGLVDNFDTKGVIQRRELTTLTTGVKFKNDSVIGLEPTESLDQRARYLQHLNEIRRINEGDDTSSSPGYALHLVRIPVSVLPGSRTRKGFGAEITVTATPYLGRDLLPTTFRNLVINDLVEQIATPLGMFFNSPDLRSEFEGFTLHQQAVVRANKVAKDTIDVESLRKRAIALSSRGRAGAPRTATVDPPVERGRGGTREVGAGAAGPRRSVASAPGRQDRAVVRTGQAPTGLPPAEGTVAPAEPPWPGDEFRRLYGAEYGKLYDQAIVQEFSRDEFADPALPKEYLLRHQEALKVLAGQAGAEARDKNQKYVAMYARSRSEKVIGKFFENPTSMAVPAMRSRNARFAFPGTQIVEVYGRELINPVAYQAFDVLLDQDLKDGNEPSILQHHRIVGYVQDQIIAAYDYLTRPENAMLWATFATPELTRAIQSRDVATIKALRKSFLEMLPGQGVDPESPYESGLHTTTAALSWAIVVESALLNERLIQDIRESATAKGGPVLPAEHIAFFMPCPSDEARDVFNTYVKTRFPIHVFALDPTTQEQNLADQLARTRELQLALSLAFVTGNISASNMTRFARRLELQSETIALNRTQVAFSHGEDTFGWRFQPRYQTPPTQNNVAAVFQTLGGGPTREGDRRQLELEPGPRECVAVVIMPSFVPYVSFETRSNWYRLNSPKHSEIDPLTFLGLSGSIKRAQALARGICDSGAYRDGDVGRLVNRVEQLAAELPFQSMIAQVPYENTHGGFELFNVGITDLAPELRSWYGAPGVSPDNPTSLFLAGDNFSVHETSVFVGNKPLAVAALVGDKASSTAPTFNLLSRQIMRVNIPGGAQTVLRGGKPFVEASVATPYGVSQPLYIPVFKAEPAEKPDAASKATTFAWSTPTLKLSYRYNAVDNFVPDANPPTASPAKGLLLRYDNGTDLGNTMADLTLRFAAPDADLEDIVLEDVPFNGAKKAFEIGGPRFKGLIAELFDEQRFGMRFEKGKPVRDVVISRTIVKLKGGGGPMVPEEVSNALTVKWVESKEDAAPAATPKE